MRPCTVCASEAAAVSDSNEGKLEYLVPRLRTAITIFGIVFFGELIVNDDAVAEEDAVAIRSIGPFPDAEQAWASAMRQYWTQYGE